MGYINVVKKTAINLPSDAILGTDYCDFNRGILSVYAQDNTRPDCGASYPITIPEAAYNDTLEIIVPITNFAPSGVQKDRCIFSFNNSSTFTATKNYLWVDTYKYGGNSYRLVYINQNGTASEYRLADWDLDIGKRWVKFVFHQDTINLYISTNGISYTSLGSASFGFSNNFNASNFDTVTFGGKSNGSQYIGTYGLNASIDLADCSVKYNSQKLRDFVV